MLENRMSHKFEIENPTSEITFILDSFVLLNNIYDITR